MRDQWHGDGRNAALKRQKMVVMEGGRLTPPIEGGTCCLLPALRPA